MMSTCCRPKSCGGQKVATLAVATVHEFIAVPLMRACRGVLRRAMCTASSSGTRPSHLTTILDVLKRTKDGDLKHVLEKQVRP